MSINLNATVFVWKIDDFMSQEQRKLSSDKFVIPGCPLVKWKLDCFPKGNNHNYNGFVAVYLNKCTCNCEVELEFQIAVGCKQLKTKSRFNEKQPDWGYHNIVARDRLVTNDCLVDDSLTIRVKVLCVGPIVYQANHVNHRRKWEPFNLASIKHGDVRLITKDKTFEAHKFMLAKESQYFDRMFDSDFQEQVNNEVDLTKFRSEVIQEVLSFIYSEQLQNFDDLSEQLLVAADYFQMNHLKSLCQNNLIHRMSAENCLQFLVIADQTNSDDLKKVAMRLVNKNKTSMDKSALRNFFKENNFLAVEMFCWEESDEELPDEL